MAGDCETNSRTSRLSRAVPNEESGPVRKKKLENLDGRSIRKGKDESTGATQLSYPLDSGLSSSSQVGSFPTSQLHTTCSFLYLRDPNAQKPAIHVPRKRYRNTQELLPSTEELKVERNVDVWSRGIHGISPAYLPTTEDQNGPLPGVLI